MSIKYQTTEKNTLFNFLEPIVQSQILPVKIDLKQRWIQEIKTATP